MVSGRTTMWLMLGLLRATAVNGVADYWPYRFGELGSAACATYTTRIPYDRNDMCYAATATIPGMYTSTMAADTSDAQHPTGCIETSTISFNNMNSANVANGASTTLCTMAFAYGAKDSNSCPAAAGGMSYIRITDMAWCQRAQTALGFTTDNGFPSSTVKDRNFGGNYPKGCTFDDDRCVCGPPPPPSRRPPTLRPLTSTRIRLPRRCLTHTPLTPPITPPPRGGTAREAAATAAYGSMTTRLVAESETSSRSASARRTRTSPRRRQRARMRMAARRSPFNPRRSASAAAKSSALAGAAPSRARAGPRTVIRRVRPSTSTRTARTSRAARRTPSARWASRRRWR